MRSKAVLSIIAFLAAFGISVALTPRPAKSTFAPYVKKGCAQSETALKITNLLAQDIENGRVRNRKTSRFSESALASNDKLRFANFAKSVSEYAEASANIDSSDLPKDFKRAWREHMHAWQKHADFLETVSNSSVKVPGNDFSGKYAEQNKEISDTWYAVLSIARKHDAYIPADAY